MNNKKLISRDELLSLVKEWAKPFIDKFKNIGGGWFTLGTDNFCLNFPHYSIGARYRRGRDFTIKVDEHWEIFNRSGIYVNIKIFNDHIEFIKDSEFPDFSSGEMYFLYEFLNERIFGIKKEKKKDNNKKLISQQNLYLLINEFYAPLIDKIVDFGGYWNCSSHFNGFEWNLSVDVVENNGRARLIDENHWKIYGETSSEDENNFCIIIYNDHIEFNDNAAFIEFSYKEMYDLYTFLKERISKVEGNNIKEENVMGVQNENNNEGSKFESAMDNYDGDVTKHRKSDEWDKMRAMVTGVTIPDEIDLDKININITPVRKTSKQCRPSKDQYYLNIAKEVAQRGTCLRRKFGAVIVNNDEIISTGYVGAPRGRVNCTNRGVCFRQENNVTPGTRYELCRSVHAEMNAVISAGRDRCIGATLYLVGIENDGSFTSNADCCSMCKRVIINAGIEKVVFRTPLGQRTVHVKDDWINDDDSLTIHEGY